MTPHVQFPPYLPRCTIDGEPHPVDAAERPVLWQTVPGIEHHVLAVVQRILRQTLPWNGNASQPHYSLLRTVHHREACSTSSDVAACRTRMEKSNMTTSPP